MQTEYTASPTVANFMNSSAFVRAMLGPVGSGKSTGCMFEIVRRMAEQEPGPDGLRRTCFVLVRQTLKQIKDTALKEFFTWVSPIAEYKVSESKLYFNFGDVRSEINLIPLDDENDTRRLLSMQITGAWINEFPEIDPNIIPALAGRCGRYPAASQGGASWSGIIMDGNFPTEGSEWHRLLEVNPPADWQVFYQPGGLEPAAENLNWLTQTPETLKLPLDHPDRLAQGRKYYERLLGQHSEDWVKRYVHAQYGNDPSGSAVFRTTFKLQKHAVDDLEPVYGHALILGQDFGRDPGTVICQIDHKGRLLVLEEIDAVDIGLEQHIHTQLRPRLMSSLTSEGKPRYLDKPVALIGDPAGTSRSTIYEETSFDVLKRAGFSAFPAPTNDIDPRIRAVESFLLGMRDGGPAFLIDKNRCPKLTRALAGGYRFGKLRNGQLKPKPDKNEYSHLMDALQYACLAAHGGMADVITKRLQMAHRPAVRRTHVTPRAWT
jgi:hypothetical protein